MKTGLIMPVAVIFATVYLVSLSSCGDRSGAAASAQIVADDSTAVPEISFNTLIHDFGVVTEGEKVAYLFTFTNSGTGSLVINSASTSCGCTVPSFSKKPLTSGQKGTMEVVFNTSGYGGIQTKTITVQSNARTPVIVLAIKADVRENNQ
ncbi:MAG: DUF1573 domain-containing protein [Bacteroidales bacterium]|nr:DUF1573 domain-containing protein [Bacteroidales bacterium]